VALRRERLTHHVLSMPDVGSESTRRDKRAAISREGRKSTASGRYVHADTDSVQLLCFCGNGLILQRCAFM
jgi:hypothetical protein